MNTVPTPVFDRIETTPSIPLNLTIPIAGDISIRVFDNIEGPFKATTVNIGEFSISLQKPIEILSPERNASPNISDVLNAVIGEMIDRVGENDLRGTVSHSLRNVSQKFLNIVFYQNFPLKSAEATTEDNEVFIPTNFEQRAQACIEQFKIYNALTSTIENHGLIESEQFIKMLNTFGEAISLFGSRPERALTISITKDNSIDDKGVKYSPELAFHILETIRNSAKPEVRASHIDIGIKMKDHESFEFTVSDNGVGFDDTIVQKFGQEGNTKTSGGTGLGLYQLLEFLRQKGGHLEVNTSNVNNAYIIRFRNDLEILSITKNSPPLTGTSVNITIPCSSLQT